MVPEGWSTVRLGDVFESRKDKGTAGLPTLSVTLRDGLVERDSLERKTDTNLAPEQHLRVEPGDIAYNMMRMWQGASGLASFPALVSPAYVVLKPTAKIDPPYAAYLFKSPRMIYMLWAYSYGLTSDRLRLYFDDFSLIPISLPPIEEQRRIAEILGTWDHAIETTENLIAASEAQKKALMQRLLTGKKRLPGFEGEWREVRLGDLGEVYGGGTPSSDELTLWDGDTPWVTPTEIKSLKSIYIYDTPRKITKLGLSSSSAKLLPEGAVLVCTRATIGELAIAGCPITTNQGFKSIVTSDSYDPEFVYYLIVKNKRLLFRMACGSTFLELSKRDFEKIELRVPELREQLAIACVLKVANDEVEHLRQKLQTLEIEKAALMQQLLTGKRRVNVKEMVA